MLLFELIQQNAVKHRKFDEIIDCFLDIKPVVLKDQTCKLLKSGKLQVKLGCGQDEAFHSKELLSWVKSIAEVDILFGFKSMDLVVLGCDKKGSDSQKLKVLLGNRLSFEEK